jgi:hypothetical protein
MSLNDGEFQMPFAPEGEPETDVWLRPLPAEEFEALLKQGLASMKGLEGEEIAALHAWFIRKYPTPTDRLNYAKRKLRELKRPA